MSHLNFWQSSHCTKWLFTAKEVSESEHFWAKRWSLEIHELQDLFCYISKFIFVACESCKYDFHIAGNASVLFRRIYQRYGKQMKRVQFNDDPRLLAVVCIFIAAKSKDCNISSANVFLSKIKQCHDAHFKFDQHDVVRAEIQCLKIIAFDLNIFLPFEACSDLLAVCNRCDLMRTVWALLLKTFKSNIYLLYPPYLVALSCIYIVCMLTDNEFDTFLANIHVPLENVTECTTHIIQNIFVKEKQRVQDNANKQQLNENSNDKGKQMLYIPKSVLMRIDAFYTKCEPNMSKSDDKNQTQAKQLTK